MNIFNVFGPIAHPVEHRADNAGVSGSSPLGPILLRSNVFTFELRRNKPAECFYEAKGESTLAK